MLIIHTIPEAIGLMMAGILLLGTWPAVWNLIEQRGRLPSHIFLDYALTYLVLVTLCALTLGQLGPDGPNFLEQLTQPNGKLVAFAIAGGFCISIGDLGMQYATALLGLSIGPPVLNALTVIIGVVLAYFLDGGINKPQLVFPGMAFSALAIGLGAAAHLVALRNSPQQRGCGSRAEPPSRQQDDSAGFVSSSGTTSRQRELDDSAREEAAAAAMGAIGAVVTHRHASKAADVDGVTAAVVVDMTDRALPPDAPLSQLAGRPVALHISNSSSSGSFSHLQQQQQCKDTASTAHEKLQRQRSIQLGSNSKYLGLAIALCGGVIYGLFLPGFQIAATDPFKLNAPGIPPLSVYTAFFYFGAAFTFTSVIANVIFLYRPPFGTKASSVKQYILDNNGRGLSILSGALAAFGDLTQFIGGQMAGYAACMLVMAYPVVGVLWGMLQFKEWKLGSKASLLLIVAQVVCYSAAVGLLAASAELRSGAH